MQTLKIAAALGAGLLVTGCTIQVVNPGPAPQAYAPVEGYTRIDTRDSWHFELAIYPELVLVPGMPVYYAPSVQANYFFYDGLFWVFMQDGWFSAEWYNGPWVSVGTHYVPVQLLRVPVTYYRRPPARFRGWARHQAPRWGEFWGADWQARHRDWNRVHNDAAMAPAPRPDYQRDYPRGRYPQPDEQRRLHRAHYAKLRDGAGLPRDERGDHGDRGRHGDQRDRIDHDKGNHRNDRDFRDGRGPDNASGRQGQGRPDGVPGHDWPDRGESGRPDHAGRPDMKDKHGPRGYGPREPDDAARPGKGFRWRQPESAPDRRLQGQQGRQPPLNTPRDRHADMPEAWPQDDARIRKDMPAPRRPDDAAGQVQTWRGNAPDAAPRELPAENSRHENLRPESPRHHVAEKHEAPAALPPREMPARQIAPASMRQHASPAVVREKRKPAAESKAQSGARKSKGNDEDTKDTAE